MALGTPTNSTTGSVSSVVTSATPGRLLKLAVTNSGATLARYIMAFNASSLPANGTVPTFKPLQQQTTVPGSLQSSVVGASSTVTFDCGPNGLQFDTGVVVAASTTSDALTVVTSNDLSFTTSFAGPPP